jgi:putative Holliday junction resolvase
VARILGIDYGKKRTGLAVTDPLQIIVSGLDTVDSKQLIAYLQDYIQSEDVEGVVFGLPTHADGNYTYLKEDIDKSTEKIKKLFPDLSVHFQDEYLTSVEAKRAILSSGARKKKRRDKQLVDKVSAILILQRFLGHI